jgi:hypothetical protein
MQGAESLTNDAVRLRLSAGFRLVGGSDSSVQGGDMETAAGAERRLFLSAHLVELIYFSGGEGAVVDLE